MQLDGHQQEKKGKFFFRGPESCGDSPIVTDSQRKPTSSRLLLFRYIEGQSRFQGSFSLPSEGRALGTRLLHPHSPHLPPYPTKETLEITLALCERCGETNILLDSCQCVGSFSSDLINQRKHVIGDFTRRLVALHFSQTL